VTEPADEALPQIVCDTQQRAAAMMPRHTSSLVLTALGALDQLSIEESWQLRKRHCSRWNQPSESCPPQERESLPTSLRILQYLGLHQTKVLPTA
jgi:hypothetical protein